jgi:hypothetical protein
MTNCSNIIDTKSIENINYCENQCNININSNSNSIITECFCKCLDDNITYILYETTIISYIIFPILLFILCICNINCFSIYNKRLTNNNSNDNSHDITHVNLLTEYDDIVPVQQPPSYDSVIIDID